MLCVLCLIVLWGFSLVTSYSGVIVLLLQETIDFLFERKILPGRKVIDPSRSFQAEGEQGGSNEGAALSCIRGQR